ncbi:MAG: class I adenylate-forming enzyme family protein [Acidimicrobiales bacterium]
MISARPPLATFAQRWRAVVRTTPEAPFLVWASATSEVRTWTYGEFDELVGRVSAGLAYAGLGPGGCVHLVARSSPAFVATWIACARTGTWMVPADPQATAPELAGQIDRIRPAVAVVGAGRDTTYLAAVESADATPAVLVVDEDDTTLDALTSDGAGPRWPDPSPSDRLAVMFTSGTTSAPKGVVLTQANYAHAGDVMAAAASLDASDRHLVVLPLFHANAQYYSFASAVSVGASVALVGAFSASRFVEQAHRLGATHASLFAAPIRMVLARGEVPIPGFALRHVWYAQNLTDDEYDRITTLLGCRPRQLYGMTETLPAVLTSRAVDPHPRAMGQVTLGCHVAVVRPGDGAPTDPGETGDLLVGGYPGHTLFSEYLDDPETTESSIVQRDLDGFVWFRTGDRARVDADGVHEFAGRGGDVLKVAGENVSVVEVESVLAEHPDVFDVAVVGAPDPVRDEVPIAYVVPHAGGRPDPDALVAWCAERLAPAKRPRTVHLVEELPRTSVGKIRKFLLTTPQHPEVTP